MAIFNEQRHRIPQIDRSPVNSPGIRGQLRMIDQSNDTNIYICTTSAIVTDSYKQSTATTQNGANIIYTAKAHGADGDVVSVVHLATGTDQKLTASITGNLLTVNLATDNNGISISNAVNVANAVNTISNNTLLSAQVGLFQEIVFPENETNLTGGVNSDSSWGIFFIT